jgi:hypothetical protein
MAIKKVVIPQNIGLTIKPNAIVSNKYDVNLDNNTLTSDPITGIIKSSGSVLSPVVTVGHEIATAIQSGTSISLKETVTKIVDALNTITYTDENSVDTVSTKITSVVNTLNPTAKTLVTSVNGINSNTLDVSALYLDIRVTSIDSTNASNYVWKIVDSDAVTHTLDLSSLVAISTINSDSIILTGNGTVTTPLKSEIKVDPIITNLIKVTATGTKVDLTDIKNSLTYDIELQDAFGITLGYINSTPNFI